MDPIVGDYLMYLRRIQPLVPKRVYPWNQLLGDSGLIQLTVAIYNILVGRFSCDFHYNNVSLMVIGFQLQWK